MRNVTALHVGVGVYPHNHLGFPVAPKRRWETRTGMGHAPADPTWAYHQPHVWIDGQYPAAVDFIDVAWPERR